MYIQRDRLCLLHADSFLAHPSATVFVTIDERPCVNVRLPCAGEPMPTAVGELYGMVWRASGRRVGGRRQDARLKAGER